MQVKKNKIKTNIYLIASNVFPNDLWMKPGARRRYLSSAREAEELSSSTPIHKGSGEPMDSSKAAQNLNGVKKAEFTAHLYQFYTGFCSF